MTKNSVTQYIVTKIFIAICVIVFIFQMFSPHMIEAYGLRAEPLAQQGYYRMVTYAFLHGGIYHLMMNMGSLYNLGSFVEDYQGTAKYLATAAVSLVLSALAVVHLSPAGTVTVGFSGVIFGIFGGFASIILRHGSGQYESKLALIGRMLLPNIIISFMPGVSWQGHLGGFVGGFVVGMLS